MAHIKIVSPSGWDFGEPIATLVKTSSRGLIGNDRRDFIKRAGDASAVFLSQLDAAKLASDEVLVHLIGLGAKERWGGNRNGDGFSIETCRSRHPTFQKYARFYRNHCFVAGTPITMADRTRRAIEDVAVGDMVATREGPRRVVRLMREEYSGPGVRISFSGIPEKMTVTGEHPLFVLRREQVHCRHRYSRLSSHRHGARCREWRDGLNKIAAEYCPAAALRPGDYALLPQPKHGTLRVRDEFARLVGWVGAEGYLGNRGAIQFTFSAKNQQDIAAVKLCLEQNGLHVSVTPRPDTECVMLSACSVLVHAQLSRYVVGTKDRKRLTGEIMEWDAPSLYAMLEPYIDGDGHSAKGRNKGQLRIRSSSRGMLHALSDVIRALGIPATIQHDRPASVMLSPTNGKQYRGNPSGVVSVAASHAPALTKNTRKCVIRGSRRKNENLQFDGMYLVRIRAVTHVDIEESVFNLEVEEQHHYLAHEVVAHNCNRDPAKSYGVVKLSAYNEAMHRVELLVGLNATKEAAERNGGLVADRELEKLACGKDLGVSMACRVPHDVCSACQNKARTRDEYCTAETCKAGGCKDNLARLVKLGDDVHYLHVLNPGATFFDMSDVFRPADYTAYGHRADYLAKAAADSGFFGEGGAKMAADLGITAPLVVILDTLDDAMLGSHLKLAYALEALSRVPVLAAPEAAALAFSPAMREPVAIDADTPEKLAAALGALADEGIVLPVQEFARLTKRAAAPVRIDGVYSRMIADGTLEDRLTRNPYAVEKTASESQRAAARRLKAAYSLDPECVCDRAMRAALAGATVDSNAVTKSAAATAETEALARDYACYQVAALERIARSRDDLLLTAQYAATQNQVI